MGTPAERQSVEISELPKRFGLCVQLYRKRNGQLQLYVVKELDCPFTPFNCITEKMKHRTVELLRVGWQKLLMALQNKYHFTETEFESIIITCQYLLEQEVARAITEEFGLLAEIEVVTALIELVPVARTETKDSRYLGASLGLLHIVALLDNELPSAERNPSAADEVTPLGFLSLQYGAADIDGFMTSSTTADAIVASWLLEQIAGDPDFDPGDTWRPFLPEALRQMNISAIIAALDTDANKRNDGLLVMVDGKQYLRCRITRATQISVLPDSDLPDYSDRKAIQPDKQKPRSDQATLDGDSLVTNQR